MLLVVDVGNTQTHFGTFRGDELLEHWRFATVRESTADELGAALRALLGLRGMDMHDLDRVDRLLDRPAARAGVGGDGRALPQPQMLVVGPGTRTGMAMRYDNPREIGADRLVNAVAAYDHIKDACIVVDFGTAITYDPVSANGEYLGGIIAPGIEISHGGAHRARGEAAEDRSRAAAPAHRQDDGRRDPLGRDLRLRGPGRRRSSGACARSSARRRRRSPPAAWRARSCPSPRRSTRPTTCSPSRACGCCTSATRR